jgi:hypothetical protein
MSEKIQFRIQTAAWKYTASGKWNYVSIFSCFIKRYCSISLHTLEKVNCQTGKGENVFWHIDDPEALFDCEDPIVRPLVKLEKEFKIPDPSTLLNSKYVQVFNRPIDLNVYGVEPKRFKKVYELILTARIFFGIKTGALSEEMQIHQLYYLHIHMSITEWQVLWM